MKKILVTGAAGYIGRNFCRALLEKGYAVRGSLMTQEEQPLLPEGVEPYVSGEISGETNWSHALEGVESVVHLAARVHKKEEVGEESLALFRRTNTDATVALAEQALVSHVRSFVFLSSVAVYGVNKTEEPLRIDSPINPTTYYGQSKWEAEKKLMKIFDKANASLIILRPTMVYGPQAPGNFARLTKMIQKGVPLPFGSINNKRFFVCIDNLISLMVKAMDGSEPGICIRFACDDVPLSLRDLAQKAAQLSGKKARIFSFPPAALHFFFTCMGKKEEWEKLSMDFDINF